MVLEVSKQQAVSVLFLTNIVLSVLTQPLPLIVTTNLVKVLFLTGSLVLVGLILPFMSAGLAIGLQALPWSYFPWLLITLLAYCVLTQFVKTRYLHRVRSWL